MRNPAWLVATTALICLGGCGSSGSSRTGTQSTVTLAPQSPRDLDQVVSAASHTLATTSGVSVQLESASVFGATPKPVGGAGAFDFTSSKGNLELNQPSGPERIIFLAQSVFVAQPNSGALLPAGKVWISAGLTENSLATNFPQFVTQVESLNPGLTLSELVWGAVSAAPAATSGAPAANTYAVEVDLARAQARTAGPSADAFRRAIGYQLTEMSGATAPNHITVYVSVDNRERVVALRSSPAGTGVGTVTLQLSRFGLPVQVSQPGRAQVADISSLAPGGERENAGGGDSDGA
ncbi:MAG: hypothetical protein JO337_01975 [Acidimicrobiales bacterium]|nr:hypothetical protein [Acidimicrobiales bacterium]